MEIPSSLERSH